MTNNVLKAIRLKARLISIETQSKKIVVVVEVVVIVTTPTYPQLNSKVGFDMKMTLDRHHISCGFSTTQTQCHPYLSCS